MCLKEKLYSIFISFHLWDAFIRSIFITSCALDKVHTRTCTLEWTINIIEMHVLTRVNTIDNEYQKFRSLFGSAKFIDIFKWTFFDSFFDLVVEFFLLNFFLYKKIDITQSLEWSKLVLEVQWNILQPFSLSKYQCFSPFFDHFYQFSIDLWFEYHSTIHLSWFDAWILKKNKFYKIWIFFFKLNPMIKNWLWAVFSAKIVRWLIK